MPDWAWASSTAARAITTPYAAFVGEIGALCVDAEIAVSEGVPLNSRYHMEWGFKKIKSFAEAYGFPWMRPRKGCVPPGELYLEERFIGLAAVWLIPRIAPSPRKAKKGATRGQPPTVLAAIYAWQRVQEACGRHVASLSHAKQVIKGEIQKYLRDFGQEAMAPDHHIPIPLEVVARMIVYLEGYKCSIWSERAHDVLVVIIKFNLVRAPRLDEWVRMFIDHVTFQNRPSTRKAPTPRNRGFTN